MLPGHHMKIEEMEQIKTGLNRYFRKKTGLIRSRLIYDFKPFNRNKLKNFYRQFILKGDLCFDLGAHTGNHTHAWLKLGAKVISVEPQPIFAELIKNKLANYTDLIVIQKAVSDKPGGGNFKISNSNPTISTLSDEWIDIITNYDHSGNWDESMQADVTTLDDLIEVYGVPAFCKIDVEGSEEQVLSGLSTKIPALSFEFFPTTPKRTFHCLEIIEKLDQYKYNWSFRETYQFNSSEWISLENIKKEIGLYSGRKSGDIYALHVSKLT
jgi:FkbM family methyltransferase